MHYSIVSLCPYQRNNMGGYGFTIKLFPGFKDLVAESDLDQQKACKVLDSRGRDWLDGCGYSAMFDPDNCNFRTDETTLLGPNASHAYWPNRDLRVTWGEWGPEHITVPGNACGLNIDRGFGCPRDGRMLTPHNVDCWSQVQLLLITFCWFAETLSLEAEIRADRIGT